MNDRLKMRKGRAGNRHRQAMSIQIVEHVYDGSPRWRKSAKQASMTHISSRHASVAREEKVRKAIAAAWGRRSSGSRSPSVHDKFSQGIWDLATCIDPGCAKRSQNVFKASSHTHAAVYPVNCSHCGKEIPILHFKPIENKWIYVFTGSGKSPALSHEIFAKAPTTWLILAKPDPSRKTLPVFEGENRHPGIKEGANRLIIKKGETYHFFLSPIQLGKKALRCLLDPKGGTPSPAKGANEGNGLNEQLGSPMVKRRFEDISHQLLDPMGRKKNNPEIVALVDPFAFALEAKEWDFLPVAQALYRLQFDKNERSKKNIASILTALIGELSEDKLDLIDEIRQYAKSIAKPHNAKAWLEAHIKCMEFLSKRIEEAALRLVEWLDSHAFRVVEIAVDERSNSPDILAMGLMTYTSIIKDILANSVGQAFVIRLVSMEKDRIPYKFILAPEPKQGAAIQSMREIYGDLQIQLLGLMIPAIIADPDPKSGEPAETLVEHLKSLGVKALVTGNINPAPGFGYKGFQLAKNSLLAIDESRIEKHGKSFLPSRIHDRIKPGLKVFTEMETHIQAAFNLFMGIKVYTEKAKQGDSPLDQAVRDKTMWEYPFQAAKFTADISRYSLALWAKKKYGVDIEKLAMGNKTTCLDSSSDNIKALLRDKKSLAVFSRNVTFYKVVTRASRYLTGPVALVFGGIDMIIQTQKTIINWQDGNPGAAAGSAMLFSAAGLGVTAAVVETLSLVGVLSQASAAAILGPVGILAALATIGAMLCFALFSKSDLELFARHCFLGDDYGEGSDGLFAGPGPKWANGVRYKSWKGYPQAAYYQHVSLINLLSSVKVQIRHLRGALPYIHYGAFIQTGYLPSSARCEVKITGTYADHTNGRKGKPVDITSIAYVDIATGEYLVVGHKDYPPPRAKVYAVPPNSWGKKNFGYFAVALDQRSGNIRSIVEKDKYGRPYDLYASEVKVRIDIGDGNHIPNGYDGTKYIELQSRNTFLTERMVKWP